MPQPGKARLGHMAPDFRGEGVTAGVFHEFSLHQYIAKKEWLILMFIPAAFSLVCPTEVLAFHNCLDEFTERGCNVAFISTDSKFCLWQWQNMPRSAGGLGHVNVPLISDQSQRMSRDYGVLQEATGLALRGMFIIDPKGIIQQITVNNIPVGRSVLEALRLVEALKAVSEKGVLCPVGWRNEQDNMKDTSFEETDCQIAQDLGEMKLKNLDNNTVTPFSLVLPPLKTNIGPVPHASKPTSPATSATTPKLNGLLTRSQRNSTLHLAQDHGVVTLDFADLLENAYNKSPHEFVNVVGDKSCTDKDAHSPSGVQRTVDVLKRISSGWSTPLASPLSLPAGQAKEGSTSTPRSGYFD